MKKVLLLVALFLGTTVMVNAQTEPAKTAVKKEVKTKVVKKAKVAKEVKAAETAAPAVKEAAAKAKK